jgi:hypothetical protein
MPQIHQIELERENDVGVPVVRGGGHGEIPVNDPPPADKPLEAPPENEGEAEARHSEQAFERALARLPPG